MAGEILSRLTTFWFDKVKDIAPTHLIASPDPSVMVVKRADVGADVRRCRS